MDFLALGVAGDGVRSPGKLVAVGWKEGSKMVIRLRGTCWRGFGDNIMIEAWASG